MDKVSKTFLKAVLPGGLIPVAGLMFLPENDEFREITNFPIHSALESLGALIAVFIGIILIAMLNACRIEKAFFWVASALIGMGVLDGFHALLEPGNTFVWLHSIAMLVGGAFMAMVWFPKQPHQGKFSGGFLYLVFSFPLLIGILSLSFPQFLPQMVSSGGFTLAAKAINLTGGICFIVASGFFLSQYWGEGKVQDAIFANHCLLFGMAGLIFESSALWDMTWWYWHLLRLIAYIAIFSYFLSIYRKDMKELAEANKRLSAEIELRKELAISSERVQVAIDSGSYFWESNFVTGITYQDSRSIELLGYEESEMPKSFEGMLTLIHPDDIPVINDKMKRHIDGELPLHQVQLRTKKKNGEWQWFLSVGKVVSWTSSGEPERFIGFSIDITEQKRVEAELRVEKENFKRMLEITPYGICEVDTEGNILIANKACHEIWGYKKGELQGKPVWLTLSSEKERNSLKKHVLHIIEKQPEPTTIFEKNTRKDGTELDIQVDWNYKRDETGKLISLIVIISDTTKRNKAERELKESQKQLLMSEKMASIGQLVAGLSHEINTPIGICLTASTYLTEETSEIVKFCKEGELTKSKHNAYLETASTSSRLIAKNIKRASELIRTFKQVAIDQSNEEIRAFDLKVYASDVLHSLTPQHKKSGIQFTISGDDEIKIHGIPGLFAQIITNFVINTINHAFEEKQHGMMDILLCKKEGVLLMSFEDNGKGIPSTEINKVFEPFYTTKRGVGGTGLGLHIVYNIVTDSLGGTISCESVFGKGTCFTIQVPLKNLGKS